MPTNIRPSMIPETPSPIPVIMTAVEKITPLAGLPGPEREWLARHGQEIRISAGDVLFEEGGPAEELILILKGELHVRRTRSGNMSLFIGRSGQMTGLLPFSRMTNYGRPGLRRAGLLGARIPQRPFPCHA